jgi:methylenetetrahydrofolate reductase (NADPH)
MSDLHSSIASLARTASIEMMPGSVGSINWDAPEWQIPRLVYLTDSSNPYSNEKSRTRTATVNAAKILTDHGMTPVPHIAARRIMHHTHLLDLVTRMQDVGVQDALLVAGSNSPAAGPYATSLDLVETGLFEHFRSIAFAAHPEGNPATTPEKTAEALVAKNQCAKDHAPQMHLVTQLCFNADTLLNWAADARAAGNELPVHAGITGPASITEKFDYARKCGLGSAFNIVRAQGLNILGILQTVPSHLIGGLADKQKDMEAPLIEGLHFFTFNNAARTVAFAHTLGQGRFVTNGSNFTLDAGPG